MNVIKQMWQSDLFNMIAFFIAIILLYQLSSWYTVWKQQQKQEQIWHLSHSIFTQTYDSLNIGYVYKNDAYKL